MERGEIGGLNYKMPILAYNNPSLQQEQQQFIQQNDPRGYDVDIDNLDGPREDVMELIENYGTLKSIISDLERRGITNYDRPDYSQPGGGLAYQAFLSADANVRYAAQQLKNQAKMREQANAARMRGDIRYMQGYDPNTQMLSEESYYNTQIDPATQEANRRTAQSYYTDADVRGVNQSVYNPNLSNLPNKYQGEELAYQQSAAFPAVKEAYAPGLFNRDASGRAMEAKSMMTLFENVTNLSRGSFPEGTYSTKVIGGQQYAVTNALAGDNFGRKTIIKQDKLGNSIPMEVERKIKEVIKDSSGKTYFHLDDGEMVDVSSMPPNEVFRVIVESNSGKYGGTSALPMFYNELEKNGLLNPDRNVSTNTVFGQGTPEQTQKVRPNIPGFDRIQTVLKEQYKDLADPEGKTGTVKVEARDGTIYKFSYSEEEGVHLSNWKELGHDKDSYPKHITYQDYLDVLDGIGAWDKFMEKRPTTNTKSIPIEANIPFNPNWKETPAQKALREYRERTKK